MFSQWTSTNILAIILINSRTDMLELYVSELRIHHWFQICLKLLSRARTATSESANVYIKYLPTT